ncbi:hypothetical protein [Labrenzia sp. DG1229]|uniref:hypothetical protein n=1 Tax=Labrenzia sp. DG1229 TaxID=681847 RepID=UPI000A94429B|nr:hypothetical protein [Labrenzia sp. DG1229]
MSSGGQTRRKLEFKFDTPKQGKDIDILLIGIPARRIHKIRTIIAGQIIQVARFAAA